MKIRTKITYLSAVTTLGLLAILFVTIFGLGNIQSKEDAAHRRQSYVANLLEIKASALSTIMLDPTQQETKDVFSDAEKNIAKNGDIAIGVIKRVEIRDELKRILDQWRQYDEASRKLIDLAKTNAQAANDALVPLYNQQFKPLHGALEKFIEARQAEAAKGIQEAKAVSDQTFWEIVILIALITTLNVGTVMFVSTSLKRGLAQLSSGLVPIKQGDLTQRLVMHGKDELADIASDVNDFVSDLQAIVQRTHQRSNQLASAANRLADTSSGLLQSTSTQSDASSTVAAAVEEFSVSIDQVAENANQAEHKANQANELSQTGGREVSVAVGEILQIETVVVKAAQQMDDLGRQATEIGSIVSVIKEVADQTNLLALNAAIEAARAGEQGRGFAVVADEVRKLAERTTSSAQQITNMVHSIQVSSDAAARAMQESNDLVGQSVSQIRNAGASMQKINDSSAGVMCSITDISQALKEQRISGVEIAQNVEKIAQMTDAGRASANEVSSAAHELATLAKALELEVAKFRA
ncbi:MAG: methyl-accepting chemotaxis protein [Rhodocyclales bacterium GT-UBC]|nr:MAG: methyl-accepting chemotaxis protein [Rhodocyclales bacterium GT-UBC]